MMKTHTPERRRTTILFFLLISALSFFTYVYGFSQIHAPIFDEHYYIPDAQRYVHHIYFEKHNPPLGKLLMAAGEWMLHGTTNNDALIDQELAPDFPPNFDYTGYRLFPVLLAWLTAPVLFLLFFLLMEDGLFALLLTLPYVFDNALIAQGRAAMLEGPLLFFCAVALLVFVWIRTIHATDKCIGWMFAGLGIAIGLASSVKFTGLVLLPLPFIALFFQKHDWHKRVRMMLLCIGSMLLVMIGVWQIHFALGTHIDPKLPDNGYFLASSEGKQIIATHAQWSPLSFPIMLRDALHYARAYSEAIPPLNAETSAMGSPPYLWPLGGRSIRYVSAPDGSMMRTIALQINPVAWLGGLIGVIASAWMIITAMRTEKWKMVMEDYAVELTLLGLYVSYLAVMSAMRRVLFLYHFFIPLLCSFILCGLVIRRLRHAKNNTTMFVALVLWMIVLCASYLWYAPLTYFLPLTVSDIQERALLPFWQLP